MIKIGFMGSHGTGKTTLVFKAATYLKENTTRNVSVLAETARECPFSINQHRSMNTEFWILSRQIQKELELARHNDILICDRTVFDVCAYTRLICCDPSDSALKSMITFAMEYEKQNPYDAIFYVRPMDYSTPPIDDGVRELDIESRNLIDKFLSPSNLTSYGIKIFSRHKEVITSDFMDTFQKVVYELFDRAL